MAGDREKNKQNDKGEMGGVGSMKKEIIKKGNEVREERKKQLIVLEKESKGDDTYRQR